MLVAAIVHYLRAGGEPIRPFGATVAGSAYVALRAAYPFLLGPNEQRACLGAC